MYLVCYIMLYYVGLFTVEVLTSLSKRKLPKIEGTWLLLSDPRLPTRLHSESKHIKTPNLKA